MVKSLGHARLAEVSPELQTLLTSGKETAGRFAASEIRRETVYVTMRDGVRLATDLYVPPLDTAPGIAMRTPYGRARHAEAFMIFARHGYIVIAQDCRGTGDSEPEYWDYSLYEREDGHDFVEWVTRQPWFDGFLAGCGGSYVGQTQWCMAMHPAMSTIVPLVSGLGIAFRTVRKHMFYNAYARTVGKGNDRVPVAYDRLEQEMVEETWATGYFNDPIAQPFSKALLERFPHLEALGRAEARRWLWKHYCALPAARRKELIQLALGAEQVSILSIESLPTVFGQHIAHDAHMFPTVTHAERVCSLNAPALMITGWYDWSINDPLETWTHLRAEAREPVRSRSRLIISPAAHNAPGYHEGREQHSELDRDYRLTTITDLLLRWVQAVREGTTDSWPRVIYYLMGANEWRVADDWPVPEAEERVWYLSARGELSTESPPAQSAPDRYTYDPSDPTPTVGGSIVSYVLPPGSVDVSDVQRRSDVLTYTTAPLEHDLDIVGPLRLILYVTTSAVDTDFAARLSDVFPDGRAIQLQSGILRARHRDPREEPSLLTPQSLYRLEIDMWATANRFRAGHRIRLDVSSADFPRYDRNTNLGGGQGAPVPAVQTIHHDAACPSQFRFQVLIDD
jgi:putative CocE/NonD family hydrolase